jgi:alkylation response protein AidB-like acyl-CoA dehydrogenase
MAMYAAMMVQSGDAAARRTALSAAKALVAKLADQLGKDAIQLHGGIGYMRDFGIETMARDVRITRIYEGTSEIQRSLIARELLKD